MRPHRLFVPFIVAILCSCTTARQVPEAAHAAQGPASGVIGGVPPPLLTVAGDGAIWLVHTGRTTVERWPRGETEQASLAVDLPTVSFALRPTADGGVFASGAGVRDSVVLDATGTMTNVGRALDVAGEERVEWRDRSLAFVTATGVTEVSVPNARFSLGRLLSSGGRVVIRVSGDDGDSLLLVTAADESVRRIAGPFAAIDSFDVAPEGTEVVFSARREPGFDIGLVSTEGGEVRWIGPDPLHERMVRWAPRGNKFAYVLETSAGSVVRSVHVTTGFQVSAPLPLTRVLDLAWEPEAERLALLVTSPEASERVETMRYDGTERQTAVPPAARSEEADQLAGVPGAVVFPPRNVRYNETLPLVIWETKWGPFAFHEDRARLQQNRRVGSVVVSPGTTATRAFWSAVAELAWVDPTKVFVVASDPTGLEEIPETFQVTVLTAGGDSAGSSERVTIVRSESGSLEDFAVLWLDERLRGFEREHDAN